MGFYGNLSYNQNSTFVFDKIYPNKKELMAGANDDGVYVGRFVLVEYDEDFYVYAKGYKIGTKFSFEIVQSDTSTGEKTYFKDLSENTIIEVPPENNRVDSNSTESLFFIYKTVINSSGIKVGHFEQLAVGNKGNYIRNFDIDNKTYSNIGKGYDSTAWVKTYSEAGGNKYNYVMVAELNNVVPTFDLVIDPPSEIPEGPYIDSVSNNIYYRIHWQSPWGFRIKKQTNFSKSDEEVIHTALDKYGKPITTEKVPGNIYYNKAGFDITKETIDNITENSINLSTASSGQKIFYDNSGILQSKTDTQELSIVLPAIGNTISKVWNVLYGPGYGLEKERNLDINWDSVKGLRMIDPETGEINDASMENMKTVAGCINSIHDLMGMIINTNKPTNAAEADDNIIYSNNGKFYIKGIEYNYTSSPTQDNCYVAKDTNNVFPKGAKWNFNIAPPKSITLGAREEIPCYIELDGFGKSLNTIHGLIIEINRRLNSNAQDKTLTRDRDTIQGCINTLNDIIDKFDNLIPERIMIVDEYGRISGADHTTAQNFGYKNDRINEIREDTAAEENKWIGLYVNTDASKPSITIQHEFTSVKDTTSTDNINSNKDDVIRNTIDLYTPIVDTKGHVVGKNIDTVTLPFGYKNLLTQNQSGTGEPGAPSAGGLDENNKLATSLVNEPITAKNTQDNITFTGKNKWIMAESIDENNTVNLYHTVFEINTKNKEDTDLNDTREKDEHLILQDISYDEAGHIIACQNHRYNLPHSFQKFKVSNITDESDKKFVQKENLPEPSTIEADRTNDIITFRSNNDWIVLNTTIGETGIEKDGLARIDIGHKQINIDVTPESKNYNLSDALTSLNNEIIIPNFEYDIAGHIIKYSPTTYTLPYNFKTLKINRTINNVAAEYEDNNKTLDLVPENTLDTLTIEGDKWILFDETEGKKLKFNHGNLWGGEDRPNKNRIETTEIDLTTGKGLYDISTEAMSGYGDIIRIEDDSKKILNTGTILIREPYFDETGHINRLLKTKYKLPFGFGDIEIKRTDISDSIQQKGEIKANSIRDKIYFSGDTWITPVLEEENDIIYLKFKHLTANNLTSEENIINNLTEKGKGNNFTFTQYTFDENGHNNGNYNTTVTLPRSYTGFQIGEEIKEPDTNTSILEFIGDDWLSLSFIEPSKNEKEQTKWGEKAVQFIHQAPDVKNESTTLSQFISDSKQTINLGGKFIIPKFKVDTKGHICQTDTVEITLPDLELVKPEQDDMSHGASIVTGIDFNNKFETGKGKITYSKDTIGNLKLTGYKTPEELKEILNVNGRFGDIQSTTSINEAFAYLTEKITILNSASNIEGSVDYKVSNAVNSIFDNAPEIFDVLKEIADWASKDETGTTKLVNRVSTNEQSIVAINNTETGILKQAKDYTNSLVGDKTVAEQISDAAIPSESIDKWDLAAETISGLLETIQRLENRIAILEAQLTTPPPTEEPEPEIPSEQEEIENN